MKLAFLGDISFNNRYNKLYEEKIKPFNNITELLYDNDLVIGNLESPCEGKGENLLKVPRLKTKRETLNYLKDINLNLALLANNHIYDNLELGYDNTINVLKELNISYIGAGYSKEEASKPFIFEKDQTKICLLNYVTKDTNPSLPQSSKIFLNWFNRERTIAEVIKYSKVYDKVILCMHWGGKVEGFSYPDTNQVRIAEELLQKGVDIIIGHHSHTLQPKEMFGKKVVYYSLGNFCFDDVIISSEKTKEIENGKGTESLIIVTEILKNNEIKFTEIPINKKELYITIDEHIIKRFNRRQRIFVFLKRYKLIWKLVKFKYRFYDSFMFYFFGNNHNFFKQVKKLNFSKLYNYITRPI